MPEKYGHFPMFVTCAGRVFLVVGGGRVALRRVRTLMKFDFDIRIVSPEAEAEIALLAEEGQIRWIGRSFEPDDLEGVDIAAACTDDRAVNRLIGELCRKKRIPVSVADAPGECSYFFPAVAFGEDIVAGIAGNGTDHRAVAAAAQRVRGALDQDDSEDL